MPEYVDTLLVIPDEIVKGLAMGEYWRNGGTVRSVADGTIVRLLDSVEGGSEGDSSGGDITAIVVMAGAAIVGLLAVISWSAASNHKKKKQVAAALVRVDKAFELERTGATGATMDATQLAELSEALNAFLAMLKQADYRNIQIQMPEDRRAALVGFCDALAAFNADLARGLSSVAPVPALSAREGAPMDVLGMISEQLAYRNRLVSNEVTGDDPPEMGSALSAPEA